MRKYQYVLFFGLFCIVTMLSSCRDFQEQKYVDIKPNETAYVIPLEQGTNDQTKFKSVDYLEQKKVAAKRVYIPTVFHSTNRMNGGNWIPSVQVITVDRSSVTREWTSNEKTGTSAKNEAINVESSNSIGFTVGITCTASIPEEDASMFLYYYGGRTLQSVMDENIRSFIQTELTAGFGARKLEDCQSQRKVVIDSMRARVVRFFAAKGIRIDNVGAAGEFTYTNPEIQTSINSVFIAKNKNDAADLEVQAANKFASAAESIRKQKNLDADVNLKSAAADYLKSGKVTWPNTVVFGRADQSLLDLFTVKNVGGNLNNAEK